MAKVFEAKEATIIIDAAADVALTNTTDHDTAFASGTNITAQFKDVSITSTTGDVEIVNLLGVTSDYQNAALEEKPAKLFEISGTLILNGDELIETEIFGTGAAGTGITTYEPGKATRPKVAIQVKADDGTDAVSFAATNAVCTEYNPSIGGADSHFEISVTIKALPADFFGPQFDD